VLKKGVKGLLLARTSAPIGKKLFRGGGGPNDRGPRGGKRTGAGF